MSPPPVTESSSTPPTTTSWNPLKWISPSSTSNVDTMKQQQSALTSDYSAAVPPTNSTSQSSGGCPVKHNSSSSSSGGGGGGCPVKHNSNSLHPFLGTKTPEGTPPSSVEEQANHPQTPHPTQKIPLSTHRVISSIPRNNNDTTTTPSPPTTTTTPHHQPPTSSNWVYPSEQQFYNAIKRKGYSAPESDMSTIVRIHNAVNERTWREVCHWERELHNCAAPRLVRFMGRPNDLSPKAWFNKNFFFYHPPFDRHDWFVERDDGTVTRYVIDFYGGNESSVATAPVKSGVNMYLDVRPAIDSPRDLLDRGRMFVREALPGIFGSDAAFPVSESRQKK